MLGKAKFAGAVLGVATLAAVAGFGVGRADQPHMQRALADLQSARAELDTAMADKGGHRVAAIRLVDQAIDEVRLGIDAGRR